jgi:hypothetical protein
MKSTLKNRILVLVKQYYEAHEDATERVVAILGSVVLCMIYGSIFYFLSK